MSVLCRGMGKMRSVLWFYVFTCDLVFTIQPKRLMSKIEQMDKFGSNGSSVIKWDPRWDPDAGRPFLYKSSSARELSHSCSWRTTPHYCHFKFLLECLQPGGNIAYTVTGGRLGNAMSSYAALLALRKNFGINTYIDQTTYRQLDLVFYNVKEVPILEEAVCDSSDPKWNWMNFDHHIRIINNSSYIQNSATLLWPFGIGAEEHVHGTAQLLTPLLQHLRSVFKVRATFINAAQEKLQQIKKHMIINKNLRRKVDSNDISWICVHIRRQDHLRYSSIKEGLRPLPRSYFLQAMEMYRQNVKNAVFIVVTDDPEWAKKQIHRSFNPQFTGFDQISQYGQESAALDFAVLISCNHTVLSRGTFGMWANIISGGTRILPKHFYPDAPRGNPLDLDKQVPIVDFDHKWMGREAKYKLKTECPACFHRI